MTDRAAPREIRLNAFDMATPGHIQQGMWTHPRDNSRNYARLDHWTGVARLLERGLFDGLFLADVLGIYDVYGGSPDAALKGGVQVPLLDPVLTIPAMAAVTTHLGFGVTSNTAYEPPYLFARRMSTLDHLTGGRIGWNIVTGYLDSAARALGYVGQMAHDDRYDLADEVMEACDALWHGWDEDALVLDRASGVFADPSKVRYAHYQGKYISTRGPLSIPRSPQVRPGIMQAGASPRGRAFAARWAEMIFATPATKADSLAYRLDIRARMEAIGRNPDECAVLPSMTVVVGETESIAREKAAYLESLVDPELVIASSSWSVAADLSKVDTPEAMEANDTNQGVQGHRDRMLQVAKAKGITFAEAVRQPRALVAGTPGMIADIMEDWFTSGACDGFILPPTIFPTTFEEFGRMVVPELQRRGIFRRDYAGRTLRENLRNPG